MQDLCLRLLGYPQRKNLHSQGINVINVTSLFYFRQIQKTTYVEYASGITSKTFGTFNLLFTANMLCKQSHQFANYLLKDGIISLSFGSEE